VPQDKTSDYRKGRDQLWIRLVRRTAVVISASLALSACGGGESVANPITPQQARAEVIDAARDIVTILHAEVAEANFSYESCNDQGDPPFRGTVSLRLWMPGIPHNETADPKTVIGSLTAHGWNTNSSFVSHSPALVKNNVNTIITVTQPPPPGKTLGAHVVAQVDGECRDTFDHRTDRSILPVDVANEVQPS
jgi:hypothetical protein